MTDEICECGHPKSDHLDVVWVKPKEEGGRTYLKRVAKGQGLCSKCSCGEFKEKG
jgi:hypothetical protein